MDLVFLEKYNIIPWLEARELPMAERADWRDDEAEYYSRPYILARHGETHFRIIPNPLLKREEEGEDK